MRIVVLCVLVASLLGCSNSEESVTEVPCVVDQPVSLRRWHSVPRHSRERAKQRHRRLRHCAPAYQEAWHVLKGKGIPQPVTFSPDGETVYATSSNAEEDGCRVWALDAETGDTKMVW